MLKRFVAAGLTFVWLFESQIAYTAARQVPGIFEVRNELKIDN